MLFGGARAVLMQAAHPLVIAGARETGFYERNPWKRLQHAGPHLHDHVRHEGRGRRRGRSHQ